MDYEIKNKKDELKKLEERTKYLQELKQIEADIKREKEAIKNLNPNWFMKMFNK